MTEEQDGGMSREEAIAMLKAGKLDEWNKYRQACPDWSADLIGAGLRWAHLSGADLSGADLSGADLIGADLIGADLIGADLSNASIGFTSFGDNKLSEVKGLDTVRHEAPSYVDIHTLLSSHGDIPECFLRGCGMPDGWIDYLPSLIGMLDPWQLYSCFLSHSSKDQAFADKLYHAMIKSKVRVWYAPEDMRGGRKSHEQIEQAIRLHDKLILVLSPHSISSEWMKSEIRSSVVRTGRRNRPRTAPLYDRRSTME